jgi:choline dehydrogenase-like flavoprotein
VNISINLKEQNTYDAIVVGSGISGGWAAKELTEKGLNVLMLERGMNIEHIKDYESAMKAPWELQHAGNLTEEQNVHIQFKLEIIPITKLLKMVGQRFGMSYTEDKRFDWYRGFHVGGKSLMWDDKVIV